VSLNWAPAPTVCFSLGQQGRTGIWGCLTTPAGEQGSRGSPSARHWALPGHQPINGGQGQAQRSDTALDGRAGPCGQAKAGPEHQPVSWHISVDPMAGQGRAVGSWRPALLQCHWGGDCLPWEGSEVGSWAMGRVGGPPGELGRDTQGCWCPQVLDTDLGNKKKLIQFDSISIMRETLFLSGKIDFAPIIDDEHGNNKCICLHYSENYGKSEQGVSNIVSVSRCWEQHCY